MPEIGVCHGADTPIWWATGWRTDYDHLDKEAVRKFLEPFGQFLRGEDVKWGGNGREDMLRWLDQDGNVVEDYKDELWDRGMEIWDAVWKAQKDTVVKDTSLEGKL
jgi:hypothetical protein